MAKRSHAEDNSKVVMKVYFHKIKLRLSCLDDFEHIVTPDYYLQMNVHMLLRMTFTIGKNQLYRQ